MLRSGLFGLGGSLLAGHTFGIPPLIKFGSDRLRRKFLPELLPGKKRACIAVTEPDAGSDVANITTTAVKSPGGFHYIVNCEKKCIMNSVWSDYAAIAVRTKGPGASGLSLIICPLKATPGVKMRRLKVLGQISAGTSYIELQDVRIPVENLVGEDGLGMRYIMTNFNHERLMIALQVGRVARIDLSSAFQYVMKREAFGKTFIEQPVVRKRLAKAAAELEKLQAWLEQFLYQMSQLGKEEADIKLSGLTALAKAKAGMLLNECAQTAALLFGGSGYTRSGHGKIIEIFREIMGAAFRGVLRM